jgi:hypothetical protein
VYHNPLSQLDLILTLVMDLHAGWTGFHVPSTTVPPQA